MSVELINLLNDKPDIKQIKIEYSSKLKTLAIFTDKKLYIIDNIIEDPKIRVEINIQFNIRKIILHPKNENQLLIYAEESIFIIPNLKKFSKPEEIQPLKIPNKNIISIKFSYFDNCFGILYKDRTFIYYLYKEDKKLEKICDIKEFDTDYIDFNFCPLFSKGFEIFMVFFMTKNGTINMYGPFFPDEFFIPKEFIFNMENYFIYKLSTMENNKNNQEDNTIYCLSLNIIDDLKKSILENIPNSDKDNNFIKISDKMKVFNSTFRKKEIKIHNNFLSNKGSEIFEKKYKQIHILNKKPLTLLRISVNNDIDIIMIGEEIMPLELAQTGNFTFNVENCINNFFIEYIKLNNNKNKVNAINVEDKEKIKIMQYNNEELFIKTQNDLFVIKIPYLNNLKTIAEERLKDIPNKMNRTNIIKLFKWNNDKNQNKKKSININDILIIPDFKKLFIFGILKEKIAKEKNGGANLFMRQPKENKETKENIILKIKEKSYSEEEKNSDLSNFKNILKEKTEYDNQINEIKNKLNENDFINSNDLKRIKLVVDEKILDNKKINFENEFNNQMNYIYKTYKDLIQNNEEVFIQKIDIMKNIYNELSQSQIKLVIDDTIKQINKLKEMKEDIKKKKEIIEKKIDSVKDKINKYELNDDEINSYLDILQKYQKTVGEKLNSIDKKIDFYKNKIEDIFSYINLFPSFDLDFNLIEKENQEKYLKFAQIIANNSKNMNKALEKI